MAIYHAHVSSGSRKGGQSGAAKVAYILREGRYAGRKDLVVSDSGNLPAWTGNDPRRLFESADLHERANGRLFVEIEVALPNELTESQQHALVRAVAAAVAVPGLPFTFAIHEGRQKSPGEPANPHAHILLSERVNDGIPRSPELWFRRANRKDPGAGGAAKHRDMKEVSWVGDTRKVIERLINEHLELAKVAERVTADSHATRIAEALVAGDNETAEYLWKHPPGMHVGPMVSALERDRFRETKNGEFEVSRAAELTDRGNSARAIHANAERLREQEEVVSVEHRNAREELRRAEDVVAAARLAGLADDGLLRIHQVAESTERGSGWRAVEAATRSHVDRKQQAEVTGRQLGFDIEAVYRVARSVGAEPVAALEQATGIFVSAQSVLLRDVEIWRIHKASESAERGSGWGAVGLATAERLDRKRFAEAAAEEVNIDSDAVYAAARSRDEDPVTALQAATADLQRAAALRAARLEELRGRPGGRELQIAHLAALGPDGRGVFEPASSDIDRVLSASESDTERLGRALVLAGNRWSRLYYGAAVKALGERFILKEFDAVLSAAASFVERVDGLSDFGRAALEAEVEKAEKPTVARLAAAFERSAAAAREETERQRDEERRGELAEALQAAAAVAERKRQAANKRVARLEVLLASFGGDAAFFAALDKRHPAWRETGTDPADIDGALDVAEPGVNRAKPVTVEHMFVVESEQAFPDASSAAWGQAGGRFADAAERARAVSQQLSDRARSRALAAEQEEPPASPDLVRRLFDWLRAHIEKLLEQLGLPPVRKTPEVLPPLSRHPAVLPPVRHQQVLPPVQRVPEVLLPARTAPQVLPPVCRREVLSPVRTTPEVLPPLSRHPAVLPPVRHQQVLPPVQRVPEVLLPARTAPQVLPPVCRREVLSPVRTTPEVMPPLSRHPAVLPPVRHQQVLPPVQRVPEVLLPARTAPQVLPPVCRREVLSPVRTTPAVLPPVRHQQQVLPPVQRVPAVLPPARTAPQEPAVVARHEYEMAREYVLRQIEVHALPDGASNDSIADMMGMLGNDDYVDRLGREGLHEYKAKYQDKADEHEMAELTRHSTAIWLAIGTEKRLQEEAKPKSWTFSRKPAAVKVSDARRTEIEREVIRKTLPQLVEKIRTACRMLLTPTVETPRHRPVAGQQQEQERTRQRPSTRSR